MPRTRPYRTSDNHRQGLESSLVCPKCAGATRVKDSRPNENGSQIRRRRKCQGCGYAFTTREIIEIPGVTERSRANMLTIVEGILGDVEMALSKSRVRLLAVKGRAPRDGEDLGLPAPSGAPL